VAHSNDDQKKQLINEFLLETEEELATINRCLTHIEKDPKNLSELDEMYRAIHTMKGASSFLQFSKLETLTHSIENILDRLRQNEIQLGSQVFDELFASIDLVTVITKSIETSGEEGEADIESRVAALEGAVANQTAAAPAQPNASEEATQTWDRDGPWEPRVRAECEAVRDHVGIIPITVFSRFHLKGPDARAYLDGLTASRLPPVGRIGLAYFADDRGRIVTEMSVIVRSDEHIDLIAAAAAQWHDAEWLRRTMPETLSLTDISDQKDCLLVTGPRARDILKPLTQDHDLEDKWLSVSMEGTVAGVPCMLVRVSFAGELGWEVHCDMADAPVIWDAVRGAGATPFGM